MDFETAGSSRFGRAIRICSPCCTAEAQWERIGLDFPPDEWPLPLNDHGWSWDEADDLGDWVDTLASLVDEATAEAVGHDAEQRADDALRRLRTKADRAGITLNNDAYAAARTQFLADFHG